MSTTLTAPAPPAATAVPKTAEQIFDAAYTASLAPELRSLLSIPEQSARATALAMKGFTVDVPIMVWGEGPYRAMQIRESYGLTWVPSMLMAPISLAPGLLVPGVTPYDPNNPPPGAIMVTTDPAMFKPWPSPIATGGPVNTTQAVGKQVLGSTNLFYAGPAAQAWPDGYKWTDTTTGNMYLMHAIAMPFGLQKWLELTGTQPATTNAAAPAIGGAVK